MWHLRSWYSNWTKVLKHSKHIISKFVQVTSISDLFLVVLCLQCQHRNVNDENANNSVQKYKIWNKISKYWKMTVSHNFFFFNTMQYASNKITTNNNNNKHTHICIWMYDFIFYYRSCLFDSLNIGYSFVALIYLLKFFPLTIYMSI